MSLWRKNGGSPQTLPAVDVDPQHNSWSDLANDPDGREACGWEAAPEIPTFDPATERVEWKGSAYVVIAIVPQIIARWQAKLALQAAGLLETVEAYMASAPAESRIYWADVDNLNRTHPVVLKAMYDLGLSDALVDELFTAAYALR